MTTATTTLRVLATIALSASTALAQNATQAGATEDKKADSGTTAAATPASKTVNPIVIQHIRPTDKRGIYMFESPKDDETPYTGFRVDFGAAFTQQWQGLSHESAVTPRVVNNVDQNKLVEIGKGFNNATANLYVNAQIARGMRVQLSSYLSARHHQETWVKDGYFLIDDSPIDFAPLNKLMEYATLRVGHMEINYGDAHFRRTDNGNAIHNPFIGNLMLDAFTTEVGAEVYGRAKGLLGMVGISNGEIKGNIEKRADASISRYAKLGFDRQVTPSLRVRLTGSAYKSDKSPSNTLFAGDRAGSRYYLVVEPALVNGAAVTPTANFRSGNYVPGFGYTVSAMQINPFVKLGGLEFFGVYEKGKGRNKAETAKRDVTQMAGDVIYRFLDDQLYVGYRYNTVEGRLAGMTSDVSQDRQQLAAGWYITPSLMLKGEYVNQQYNDFAATDLRHKAKFNGFMVEGVVAW